MEIICIIYWKSSNAQWQVWARAITASKFKIKIIDSTRMRSHSADELRCDAFLLDGMQPDLAKCIKRLNRKCPDSRIIVATELESSMIKYDVLHNNEALYVSGPLLADEFAEAFQRMVRHEFVAA